MCVCTKLLNLATAMIFVAPMVARCQVATGIYNFGAFNSNGFDTVNIGNLNVHFEIPVFSKIGRGGLNFMHNLVYDNSIWTPTTYSGSKSWQPAALWGWQADTGTMTGNLSFTTVSVRCTASPLTYVSTQGGFVYMDWNGVNHQFFVVPSIGASSCSGLFQTSGAFAAADNSGIKLVASSYNSYSILFPNGQSVVPLYNQATGTTTVSDNNGNSITSTGTVFTDTTGTNVLTLTGAGTPSIPRLLTYPTYVGGTQSTASITIYYTAYSVQTAFGCSGIAEYHSSSVNFVDHIVMADGETYYFTYEATPGVSGSITGRIASVELPGGGHIDYAYSGTNNGIECQDGGTATLTRTMPDDPSGPTSTYARTPGTSGLAASSTQVTDSFSKNAVYDFVNIISDSYHTPYVVEYAQYNGAVSGTPALSTITCYNGETTCVNNPLMAAITSLVATTTLDGTYVKQISQTFNSNGLLTAETDYDFGSSSPGAKVAGLAISYASLTNGIVNRPATISVYGSQTAPTQTTTYTYDGGTLTPTSGLPHHSSVTGSRGNLTSATIATSTSTSIPIANNAYDDAGQLLTSTDVNSNTTTYGYDSATDTFQTSITLPSTGVTHSTGTTYDTPSGLELSSIDQNGNLVSYAYDNMLRLLTITGPGSASQTYTYSLASSTPSVTYATLHSGSSYISSISHLDAYGRLSETENTDSPSNDLATYAYDADGREHKTSNPYRSGDTPAYTQVTYDELSRPITVLDSDGASQATYTYLGNTVTVTDEASKKRELVSDAEGRLTTVFEPDASNNLTLETDYQYDQNQTSGSGTPETYQTIIAQKGGSTSSNTWRVRTFTYDTLGRMVTSNVPEAGSVNYTYPVGGSYCAANLSDVCKRTDANSTVTTYSYDALSRLTGKVYSGFTIGSNTHSVSYLYDQTSYNGLTISNGKGNLTGMSDGSGETAWSYDALGNILAVRKTLNSVTRQADYSYYADSTINTATDFGGTTLTYSYNSGGYPTQIVDGSGNAYVSSVIYNAAGQLISANHQLTSTGAAYIRSWQYNNRLQPSAISATLNGTTIQSLTYGYGTGGTNNGDILSITNGMAPMSRSQTYTYDNLNRLASGHDNSNWGETYTYDNWSNLYQVTRMSGYSGGNNWALSAPGANNELSNQSYDSAGEVTSDQFSNSYNYDAEGRILSAGAGSYVYDGSGNRVEKTVGGTSTLYWYGAGSLLDESNSSATSFAKQIGLGGLLMWSENLTSGGYFIFQDQLGSTRVTGDSSGNLHDDIDYLPFGSAEANYGISPSNGHYTFTGYESDQSESDTDYAIFRNLSTSMGRFNRPDPYDGSYDLANPQSLNRYSYVVNSPLIFNDIFGLTCDFYEYSVPNTDGTYGTTTYGTYYCDDDGGVVGITHDGDGGTAGGGGGGVAPNNGNQTSWQQKMRQASHYICGKSPGDRVAKSVLTGAGIGAVTGGFGGFVAGEVFGGEVTFGLTGIPGAYIGAHVGAAVGAMNGLTTGAVMAGICYAGFQYDN